MIWLMLGALAVVVLAFAGRLYTRTDPARLGGSVKLAAAIGLALIALAALARAEFPIAVLLGGVAIFLSGAHKKLLGRLQTAARAVLESSMIKMTLDPSSGALDGVVCDGMFEGYGLAELDLAQLMELRAECEAKDSDGVRLLEVYLDRRFGTQWRVKSRPDEPRSAHHDGPGRSGAGSTSSGSSGSGSSGSGAMSRAEAYAVLGLKAGATPAAVKEAHRRLMIKLHPDQGGSTYLAAKINRAREVLLEG